MNKKCLKCGYERKDSDMSHDYACPNCGVIYSKYKAKLEKDILKAKNVPKICNTVRHGYCIQI